MKKYILGSLVICLFLFSCNKQEEVANETKDDVAETVKAPATKFGVEVDEASAMTLASLTTEMTEKDSLDCVVKGTVESVCQKKGCWMTLKKDDGSTVRVTFKDYALFMPKDLGGKEVVLHGIAKTKTVSVDMLKHLAEDAGKSEEEIAAITDPETKLAIEADGVTIQ